MLYAIVVVLLLIVDQGLKYWVTVHVALNEGRQVLIPHVLDVMNIHNYGIAFSWLQNVPSWVFAIIAAVFAVIVIIALRRGMIHGCFGCWMAVLALAGALGNCIDRLLSGYVVDMFQFAFWQRFPVFNFADACLVVGGIAFCLYVVFHKDPEEAPAAQPEKRAQKAAAPAPEKQAEKPSAAQKPAEKRAAAQKAAAARAAAKPEAAPEQPAAPKASAPADDPFAAWDRAVSEQDAQRKAAEARKAEREAKRRAEQAQAEKKAAAAPEQPAAEPAAAPKPAVDDAPTRHFAAQKAETVAEKLGVKKPEPAPAPEKPAEEPPSYDLEDILREFSDL